LKYNDLGMLIQEFQAHAGAVDDDPEGGVSPNVQYGYKATFGTYNEMSNVYTKAMRLAEVVYPNDRKGGFGGWFRPASGAYELVAFDKGTKKPRWSETVPIRVRAMVAAGKTLFVAGPPDVVEASDPWAAFDGRKGGVLRAVSVGDGSKLAEHALDSPPVYDGLVAAGGRLYLSALDGKVVCLAAKP